MQTLNEQNADLTPTELRATNVAKPMEINNITEADFNRFIYSGISVTVKTPFIKTNNSALFAVNLDGFLPSYQMSSSSDPAYNYYGSALANLFPVQPFATTKDLVEIDYEWNSSPIVMKYMSYRMVSGSINVGIRIISNVGQTGTFMVTQAKAVSRRYYSKDEEYRGLRFANASDEATEHMPNGFVLFDISTNRNVSITTMRNDTNRTTDLMKKIDVVQQYFPPIGVPAQYRAERNNVSSQFLEDWLLFAPLSDFPATSATQFTFSFFFDYSHVTFQLPVLPLVPMPSARGTDEIMLYIDTVWGQSLGKILKETTKYKVPTVNELGLLCANIDFKLLQKRYHKIKGEVLAETLKQILDSIK